MEIFSFLNNHLLKMKWLFDLTTSFLENIFGVDISTRFGSSIHFFIYDTIKIFILLCSLIFIISYIQSFFPPERTKRLLGGIKGVKGNVFGGLLGIITPFCSCSSIPIFIGFISAGLPVGVTFSFLISSPLVDLASILLLMSFFGAKIAFAYVLVGLIIAIIGGMIIDKMKMEKYIQDYVKDIEDTPTLEDKLTRKMRIDFSILQVKDIIKKVWLYIIIGVGIGALIHNWIPKNYIEAILGNKNPFSVVIATFIGIPMYADIFGTLPVAEALFQKGVGIGTVLSFMMAVTALSLPSMIMLSKVIKKELLFLFITIVTIGILLMGYIFNMFSYLII